jgi:uncharacterized membrane protein
MKALPFLGIVLIILGVASLAYQRINYTTHKKIVDIGSFQATTSEQKTIPLPPIIGAVALIGGIALILTGRKAN